MKIEIYLQLIIIGILLFGTHQLSKIKYVYEPCTKTVNTVNACWTNILNCEKPMTVMGVQYCPTECAK